eukprot:m.274639 g.274639  ORF g.274639 m.274639 type:complete len:1569 (+) comp17691_c0_seq2:37-4743(+)
MSFRPFAMANTSVKAALKAIKASLKDQEYENAVQLCKELLSEESNYQAHVFMGLAYSKLNKPAEAEACYKSATEHSPEELLAWHGLVGLLEAQLKVQPGREEDLIAAYEQVLKIAGDQAEVKGTPVLPKLVRVLEAEGYFRRAAACLVRHVDINPDAAPDLEHALTLCQQDRDIKFKRSLKERPKPSVLQAQLKLEAYDAASELSLRNLLKRMSPDQRDGSLYASITFWSCLLDLCSAEETVEVLKASRQSNGYLPKEASMLAVVALFSNAVELKEIETVPDGQASGIAAYLSIHHQLEQNPSEIQWDVAIRQLEASGLELMTLPSKLLLIKLLIMRGVYASVLPLAEQLLELIGTIHRDVGRPLFLRAQQQARLARARAITALEPLRWDVATVTLNELKQEMPDDLEVVAAQVELEVCQSLLEEAKTHLEETAAQHATSAALLTAKGFLALKTLRLADAVDSLLASKELRNVDFSTTLALGRAYLASKQLPLATSTLLQAARLNPSSSLVFASLGQAFVETDPKRAEQCFRKAVALDPSDEQAGNACWQLLMEQGRVSEADGFLREVSRAPNVAQIKWIWLRLGLLALREMDASAAIAALQKALRNARNNAQVWHCLGQAYLQRGSYASALKALGRSIELQPALVEAQSLYAQVQRQLGQLSEAINTYQACLVVQEHYPPAVEGLLLSRLDATREALGSGLQGPAADHIAQGVELFLAHVARCGGYVCIWKHVGDLLNATFHLDAAHSASMQATMARLCCFCGLDASTVLADITVHVYAEHVRRAQSSGAWYDLALAQYRQAVHQADGAIGLQAALQGVQQSLHLDSTSVESWELLGAIATELKHFDLALRSFARCASLSPNEGAPWVDMGVVYLLQDNINAANKAFSHAQALDPGLARAWIGQAMVATTMASREALDLLRHAFELFPHPTAALGFAARVVAALTPDNEQHALQLLSNGTVQFGDLGTVPSGHVEAYCQQAAVALARYCHTPQGQGNASARCLQGIVYERLQLYDAAIIAWQQCHALLAPTETERQRLAQLSLARAYCLSGEVTKSVQLYGELVPTEFGHICQWGRALVQAGQLPQAFQVYNQAKALVESAGSAVQVANVNASLGLIAFANGDMELCKQLLFLAVQDSSACPEAIFIMAGLGIVAGDGTLTQAALAEFPRLFKAGVNKDAQHIKSHLKLWALAAAAIGDSTTAKRAALRLIHTFPHDPELRLFLAQVLNGQKGTDGSDYYAGPGLSSGRNLALQACQQALKLSNWSSKHVARRRQAQQANNESLYAIMAASCLAHPSQDLWKSGDIQAYRKHCKTAALQAVHIAPHQPQSWAGLAAACLVPGDVAALDFCHQTCIRTVGMVETARAKLTHTRLDEPQQDNLLRLRIWCELTACHALLLKADCSDEGVKPELCKTAIQVATPAVTTYAGEPNTRSDFLIVLGMAHWKMGNADDAMASFSQATGWQQIMAMEQLKQGRIQTAAECFEQATLSDFAHQLQAALTLTLANKNESASAALSQLLTLSNSQELLRLVLGLNKKQSGDAKACKKELKRLADSHLDPKAVALLAA